MGGFEAVKTEVVDESRYPTSQVGSIELPTAYCTPLSVIIQGLRQVPYCCKFRNTLQRCTQSSVLPDRASGQKNRTYLG